MIQKLFADAVLDTIGPYGLYVGFFCVLVVIYLLYCAKTTDSTIKMLGHLFLVGFVFGPLAVGSFGAYAANKVNSNMNEMMTNTMTGNLPRQMSPYVQTI